MSRKNYRKKREKSFGYADAVENVQWGSQTASVIFQGAFSPVPISNKSTRGINPNSRGILFQNGSISNFFAGHRRRIPIPRLIPGPSPERFTFPFKTWISLSGETYLGGDRASFQPDGLVGLSPLGFASYGRAQLDYAFDIRTNDGTNYTFTGLGQNTYSTTQADFLDYAALGTWRSQEANTLPSSVGRVTGLAESALVGTPLDATMRILNSDYPPVLNGWEGSYPEFYFDAGSHPSINRTYNIVPGYNGAPTFAANNSGTYVFSDSFIGAGIGGGATTLTNCTEEDANLPDLGFMTSLTIPGRQTSINENYSVDWTEPEPSSILVNGVKSDFPGTHTYTESYNRSTQASITTRNGNVVAICIGTGTFSFVPRITFRIDWEAAPLTGQGTETLNKQEEFVFKVGILDGVELDDSQTYFETINFDAPAVTDLQTINSFQTWDIATTLTTTNGSTQVTHGTLLYDDFGESCLYRRRTRTVSETLNKSETRNVLTQLTFDASSRVPNSLESTLSIFSSGAWLNTFTETGTISISGTKVESRDQTEIMYYRDTTQEIEFGEILRFIEGQISEDLSTKNVGDTITTNLVNLQTARNYNQTLTVPSPAGTTGAESYAIAIDATSQVVGRRFLVTQDLRGSGQNYKLFICTGTALGAQTGSSQGTYTEETTFASLSLLITEIIPNFYSPPRGGGNRFFRWDDYNDFYRSSVFETYKKSTTPGVLIDAYYVSGHLDISTDQTWGYSTSQLLDTGKIAFTGTQVTGQYVGHTGTTRAIKVNP